jgi:hypothetical protein
MITLIIAAAISATDYKATTSIEVNPVPAVAIGAKPYDLAAVASNDAVVSYQTKTPALCTVAGATVTPRATGMCVLVAKTLTSATHTAGSQPFEFAITAAVTVPAWTAQQKYFAGCGNCPSTGKIETASCLGYDIVAITGGACVDSALCKWIKI